MELFFNISRYFRYLFTAKTPHGVHSPFVFDFINNLLRDKTPFYAFGTLRKAREAFLSDNRTVTVTDFGSGGKSGLDKQLRIRHLAIRQALPAKYANLLFRMVNHFQPEKVLELGTSLGLTTLHLAAANTKAKIITIEGSPGTSAIASELFEKYEAKSIE
ncbi:MAG: SAM-dependent methyltransferase, partial [Bacteroidota bacterium]